MEDMRITWTLELKGKSSIEYTPDHTPKLKFTAVTPIDPNNVEKSRKYQQIYQFELYDEKSVNMLDPTFHSGDLVRITFRIKGRRWDSPQGRTCYFTTFQPLKLEHANAPAKRTSKAEGGFDPGQLSEADKKAMEEVEDDDMPF